MLTDENVSSNSINFSNLYIFFSLYVSTEKKKIENNQKRNIRKINPVPVTNNPSANYHH